MAWPAALNVHAGQSLPAARAIILGVPLAALFIWWYVTRHRRPR